MWNFKLGIFGFFESSSLRVQSRHTKWKLSFSASSWVQPRQAVCCQTLHFSQAMLGAPSSYFLSVVIQIVKAWANYKIGSMYTAFGTVE